MGSALDVFPGEVWLRIIRISCADTSFTARTLSLVSRDIYKLTKPYRVQSVSLLGVSRIFGFYKALTSSPENLSRVVHLLIGCPSLRQENEWLRRYTHKNSEVFAVAAELLSATGTQDSDAPSYPPDSITEVVLGECIQRILTLVGTSLNTSIFISSASEQALNFSQISSRALNVWSYMALTHHTKSNQRYPFDYLP